MANATLPNLQKQEYQALVSAVNVTNKSNQNLDKSQKELLKWHYKLGHIGMKHVKYLINHDRIQIPKGYLKECIIGSISLKCAA